MKRLLIAAAIAATSIAVPAFADSLSLSIGQPGFYGQINIGGYPPPAVVYSQPVIIQDDGQGGEPIYLRVPPQQSAHWDHYCHAYHACNRRVMFVRDDWYRNQYAPRYMHDHGGDHRHDNRDGDHRHDDHGDHGNHGDHHDDHHDDHRNNQQPWPQQ